MFDEDTPICEECKRLSEENGIRYLVSTPHCIEGWLLKVLGQPVPGNSKSCKRKFHSCVLSEREKLNQEGYQNIFPPEDLKKGLCPDPLMDQLIRIFQNQLGA